MFDSSLLRRLRAWVPDPLAGRFRTRVAVLLACVLALESADTATIGAAAPQLEQSLGIGNAQVGLLVSVSTGVGALATLPAGALTDRANRSRMLAGAVLVWSVALGVGGLSSSFQMLLLTRVALGALVAAAGPTVASLVGDYFPTAERGSIYGVILSGERVGAGIGLVVSGDVAASLSWRYAFWVLALPGVVLAGLLWRLLPEPARDGSSRLLPRDTSEADVAPTNPADQAVHEEQVAPHSELVLHADPARRSLWWAVRYVWSIRTNRVLILASALSFFFFSGIQTFAVVLVRGRYGLEQGPSNLLILGLGVGAIAGSLAAGRLADRRLARHHLSARPVVAGAALIATAVLFVPALGSTRLLIAAPLFILAAAGLGASNPPLDAARLDLMPARLWGRAEAVRTVLRYGFGATAPVTFGWVSTQLDSTGAAPDQSAHHLAPSAAAGLANTFMVMLAPLLMAGVLLILARRTYPRDVATAVASDQSNEPEEVAAGARHPD